MRRKIPEVLDLWQEILAAEKGKELELYIETKGFGPRVRELALELLRLAPHADHDPEVEIDLADLSKIHRDATDVAVDFPSEFKTSGKRLIDEPALLRTASFLLATNNFLRSKSLCSHVVKIKRDQHADD